MKILLVEDHDALRHNIEAVLKSEGYTVVSCADGIDAEFQIMNNSSDLILLDRMLPGQDGLTITRKARAQGITTPILMLTALDSLGDKVSGLDAGADDYIVKPFAMEELLARLRIWSRRSVPLEDPSQLDFGDLCYQPGVRLLKGPEGEEILPKRLAQLMELLLRSAGTPITRSVIFNRIWGPDAEVTDAVIDTYIHLVRQRLIHLHSKVKIINSRGTGYQLQYEAEVVIQLRAYLGSVRHAGGVCGALYRLCYFISCGKERDSECCTVVVSVSKPNRECVLVGTRKCGYAEPVAVCRTM